MARVIQVGSDKVIWDGARLLIDAKHPIQDWGVREFCQHAIYFKGQKFRLAAKRRGEKTFAIRYELHAWPPGLHEESPVSFTYDAEFVTARDAACRTEQRRTFAWHVLLPLYPVLGLFWSRFKERALWPLGFVPVSITSASVMLVFCFTFCDAILYGYLGGGLVIKLVGAGALGGWAVLVDLLLIGLLALDCAVRFGQLLRGEDAVPDGFLEWLPRLRH